METPIGLFRAHITPVDRLVKQRWEDKMLDDLLGKLRNAGGKKGGQSYLFIGRRGIGKTHFLSLIEHAVRRRKTSKGLYTVIRFPEETTVSSHSPIWCWRWSELLERRRRTASGGPLRIAPPMEKDEEIVDAACRFEAVS